MIYPLVLIAMRKFMSIQTMKFMLLAGTILGFILSVIATYKWPNPAYFLLPTRAWEMMIGELLIFTLWPCRKIRKGCWKERIGTYSRVLFFISAEDLWPGYLAVFPVIGTFLMIQSHRNDSIITNNIVFQKLGAWSYSIYLWHWPLVVLIYIYSLPEYYVYAGIALSIVLGFLSYKYIEQIKLPSYHQWKDIYRIKPLYFSLVLMGLGSYFKYIGLTHYYL